MGNLFYDLARERSAITTFFVLVLFCIILSTVWKASKYPYILKKRVRHRAYLLILTYFIFAMNDGDWFHLYNLFGEPSFRAREASDISSQSSGLEAAYYYIARCVGYNYILFRFIVWGGASVMSYALGARLGVNKNLYLFFFVIISLDILSFQRCSLAMSFAFLGYSFIIKPVKRHSFFSILFGVFLILFSTLFHKSAFFLIPVFLLSFISLNKRSLLMLILSLPFLIYFINGFLIDYILNMIGADTTLVNSTVMQSYLERDNRSFGIGSTIRHIILPLMFLSLFFYIVKHVIIRKVSLPNHIRLLFNSAFYIIIISFLIFTIDVVNVSEIYMRLLYYSVLPLSVILSFIYGSYKHITPNIPVVLICITCSFYKIILNLLGTIFL